MTDYMMVVHEEEEGSNVFDEQNRIVLCQCLSD